MTTVTRGLTSVMARLTLILAVAALAHRSAHWSASGGTVLCDAAGGGAGVGRCRRAE